MIDPAGPARTRSSRMENAAALAAGQPLITTSKASIKISYTKYSYDAVGNRLTSLSQSYAYNTSNEMSSNATATFTYDNNGNTLTKTDSTGTTQYAWDFENRLTSVTLPGSGGTVSFKYDPFGRRIYKSFSSGTSIYTIRSET